MIFISRGDIANIPDQYKNGILWKMGLYFFSRSTNMSSLKSGHMGYMWFGQEIDNWFASNDLYRYKLA